MPAARKTEGLDAYRHGWNPGAGRSGRGATSTFNLVQGAGHGDQAITISQTPVALEMLKSVFGK